MGAASAPFIYLRANTNTRTADVLVALQDIQAILNQHAEILLRVDAALKTSRRGRAQMGGLMDAALPSAPDSRPNAEGHQRLWRGRSA